MTPKQSQGKEQRKQLPLKEGLFKLPSADEEGYLIGSRCRSCQTTFFPKRHVCLNCGEADMDEVPLSRRGRLHSFTIARMTPPGSIIEAPYALGLVRLPEEVVVQSVLTQCDLDALEVDTEVELVFEKVTEDEEGNGLIAFKFRPV